RPVPLLVSPRRLYLDCAASSKFWVRPRLGYRLSVTLTSESRVWEALFAGRTRLGSGDGIAAILGFLGDPSLISFAGGFPDPRTFPAARTAALLQEFAESGEVSAFQ